jgi:hypothetical protein
LREPNGKLVKFGGNFLQTALLFRSKTPSKTPHSCDCPTLNYRPYRQDINILTVITDHKSDINYVAVV